MNCFFSLMDHRRMLLEMCIRGFSTTEPPMIELISTRNVLATKMLKNGRVLTVVIWPKFEVDIYIRNSYRKTRNFVLIMSTFLRQYNNVFHLSQIKLICWALTGGKDAPNWSDFCTSRRQFQANLALSRFEKFEQQTTKPARE